MEKTWSECCRAAGLVEGCRERGSLRRHVREGLRQSTCGRTYIRLIVVFAGICNIEQPSLFCYINTLNEESISLNLLYGDNERTAYMFIR